MNDGMMSEGLREAPRPQLQQDMREKYSGETLVADRVNYSPDKDQILRENELNIKFMHKGGTVRVGCMSFAFSTNEELMDAVLMYVNDPKAAAEKYGVSTKF